MDFIVAASNLRAANYDITPADRHKVLGRKETELHITRQRMVRVASLRRKMFELLS